MTGGWTRFATSAAVGLLALLVVLVIGAVGDDDAASPAPSGVAITKIPKLAKQLLPVINDVLDRQCPELPAVWVVAEIQAESSWNPHARSNDRNGGAAGLYQINDRNWAAAGGRRGEITVPETHLRVGIPWVCTNLRAVTSHLKATGKPTEPLDAMLVCHVAGCGRVTGSATGVPKVGEAGCGATCVSLINRYIANVHRLVERYSTPPAAPPGGPAVLAAGLTSVTFGDVTSLLPAAPAPFAGPRTGCTLIDPTGPGCLTAAARYGLDSVVAAFGSFQGGPTMHSAGCWDAHAWNPASDHAKGRACDLFPGRPGAFARDDALQQGWRLANWYRANAEALHVDYLIWQGRYWRTGSRDVGGGWGERYDGGGVYNARGATGGHYDHVHVSYRD